MGSGAGRQSVQGWPNNLTLNFGVIGVTGIELQTPKRGRKKRPGQIDGRSARDKGENSLLAGAGRSASNGRGSHGGDGQRGKPNRRSNKSYVAAGT